MQPAPVDLDTEDLLQSHVAEVDGRAEMIEQRELAALARRLEDDCVVPERIGERVGKARVQIAVFVEEADGLGALTGLDDELDRAGVEPLITLLDENLDGVVVEIVLVLLPQLEQENLYKQWPVGWPYPGLAPGAPVTAETVTQAGKVLSNTVPIYFCPSFSRRQAVIVSFTIRAMSSCTG